ncbi:MAG TPA: hypothetical protein PK715_13005, partial [Chitinophagales bacterium]|nr:hypothetical protein [Chitinophagales bacterium]
YQKVKARAPLMELYKYSSTLRSLTQGRAKHQQHFVEYAQVPADIQQQLIEKHQKEAHEEHHH